MIDINLLPPAQVLSRQEKSLRGQIMRVFIITGVITVLATAAIIGARIFFQVQLNSQTNRKNQLLAEFNSQIKTAQELQTVKYKATGIKIIQTSRTDFATMAASLNLALSGVIPKNILMDSDGNITINASAADLTTLGNFINTISNNNPPFTKVVLSGLVLNAGSYDFNLGTQYAFSRP